MFGEDGRGRAPCIIAAYMMMAGERQHKRLTLSMALKHMESKWASEINGGFLSKLIALEKSLYGEVGYDADCFFSRYLTWHLGEGFDPRSRQRREAFRWFIARTRRCPRSRQQGQARQVEHQFQ